ncbi:hypothetical protein DFH07DRAFT_395358 [Mycena maculata]|uniref:Zn(2)-C6 fungal-type domain-containing protein n=1 Tax=Mycena maculata TaxID=230809 RepID=A0AAD7NIJ2_9AGAR|nr:hypothetical protein DFH07DRAFT_395358 [Mycena maculata]
MSGASQCPKSDSKTPSPTNGDHRKRRRNRLTQSCLNCHATKRMCDRKRPCSRCSQLGLTGNCVYETDDPSSQDKQDEGNRLMGRIAELEGVIRELKNKPHPRWLAEQDRISSDSDGIHPSPPSSGGTSPPVWAFPSSPPSKPSGVPPLFSSQTSAPCSSYANDTMESLLAAYTGLTDHMYIRRGGDCGCLNEVACYSVVLDLSLRLRKTADVLARSPSHAITSGCALSTRISELDTLVKRLLLNVPNRSAIRSGVCRGMGPDNSTFQPDIFNHNYENNDTNVTWDLGDLSAQNEDLMSWVPTRM